MDNIFSLRLKSARVMRGLSMDELCNKMDNVVSKQSISKYEAGKMMPDGHTLIVLAKALCVKVDYFFTRSSISIDSMEFRKKAKLSKKEMASIEEEVKDRVEKYFEIESILDINSKFIFPSDNTIQSCDDIITFAKRLKIDWQLGEDGINNLIEILESKGVKVIEIKADSSFDGMSGLVNENYPIIVINKSFIPERKRFTILHELGHLLLKFDDSIDQKSIERYCNLFANEMLISKDIFIQLIGKYRKSISVKELQSIQYQFGISIEAQMFKAKYLNIISESMYKSFCIKKNQDSYLKKLLSASITKEENSSRFDTLVYKALSTEIITESKASVLLNVPQTTIRDNSNFI